MEVKLVLTITRQSDLDSLNAFLKGTSIQSSLLFFTAAPPANIDSKEYADFSYIPNMEFKAFCGAENLNGNGHISIRSAYDIIMEYATGNCLTNNNDIQLNAILSHTLKSDKHNILISELPAILVNLFKKVVLN